MKNDMIPMIPPPQKKRRNKCQSRSPEGEKPDRKNREAKHGRNG